MSNVIFYGGKLIKFAGVVCAVLNAFRGFGEFVLAVDRLENLAGQIERLADNDCNGGEDGITTSNRDKSDGAQVH